MEADNFVGNLIENVQKQKCLYDKRNGFYFNRNVKEKAWKEVAVKCLNTVAACKHRWKLLRERFVKEIKRMEAPSGTGMCYLEEWKYFKPLMFLKDSLAPRRNRNKVEDMESVFDDNILTHSVQDPPTPTAPCKIKSKVSLDSLYQKFGETIEKLEKSCSTASGGSPLDEAFLNIAGCLMNELPEPVKEDFQARMLQELYRLRRENINLSLSF